MSGLFDDDRADRLLARGWVRAGKSLRGRRLWRRPDGLALMEEGEAVAAVEREELAEARGRVEEVKG